MHNAIYVLNRPAFFGELTVKTFAILTAALLAAAAPASAATLVNANIATPTSLGTFAAGKYKVTTTGTISLAGTAGDGQFDVDANGVPVTPVTYSQYSYFNPAGSTIADGQSGIAPGLNIGSLVGSLVANPGSTDFFSLGSSATLVFAGTTTLYGAVNDLSFAYGNNGGAFSVSIAAIPEPAQWAMLIGGFGVVGGAMRSRRRTLNVTFA